MTFKNEDTEAFYTDCVEQTDIVLERIEWLLDGNYGYDELRRIVAILQRPRMNHNAIIFQTIAQLEWQVNQAQANKVYNALSFGIQDKLNNGINTLLPDTEAMALSKEHNE